MEGDLVDFIMVRDCFGGVLKWFLLVDFGSFLFVIGICDKIIRECYKWKGLFFFIFGFWSINFWSFGEVDIYFYVLRISVVWVWMCVWVCLDYFCLCWIINWCC